VVVLDEAGFHPPRLQQPGFKNPSDQACRICLVMALGAGSWPGQTRHLQESGHAINPEQL
jgi:hypothetical protein